MTAPKSVNIPYDAHKAQVLADLLDAGVKAHGINYARSAIPFIDELQAAFAPKEKAPKP